MVEVDGAVVAAHFGSVVGEMAVLWHAVGIADRSELAKLELRGAPEFVTQSAEYLSGTPVEPPSVMRTKGSWWLPIAPDRMMILCEPRHREELAGNLEEITRPTERSSWVDVSGDYAAIALVGPNAQALLEAAGAGDGVEVPEERSLRDTRLAGRAAVLVRETAWEFLLVVRRAEAADTWAHLDAIGGDFGIGNVGHEAIEHSEIGTATMARQIRAKTAS
jgi:glycine cleavage system aminomethyltransferase T